MILLKIGDKSRSPSPGRLPRPEVDLPPYQDPYPVTGYDDIPVDVPIEGMVCPTQYPRPQQPELVQMGAAGGGPPDEPSDGSLSNEPRDRRPPRRDDDRRDKPEHPPDRGPLGGRPPGPPGGDPGRGPPRWDGCDGRRGRCGPPGRDS